jgi:chemotaxis protein methyltransferase CheR
MSSASQYDKAREFEFTSKDFEQVRKLIYDHAGISLNPSKEDMVYSRLARRLRATGLDSFSVYLSRLEKDGASDEWQAFVNSLTTNLTAFFREEHHFPLLAEHIRKQRDKHPIMLWCSASSTGEEPYSMAMTILDLYGSSVPPVKILATDLDTNVLAKAEAGVYPLERLEKLPEEKLKRYFLKGKGDKAGFAQVRPELRNMITFRQLNLLDKTWPIRGPFDAIFCRNVMIYFDKQTQLQILQKFAPMLQADGLLFAGHSESFHNAADIFKLRAKTVYELAKRA